MTGSAVAPATCDLLDRLVGLVGVGQDEALVLGLGLLALGRRLAVDGGERLGVRLQRRPARPRRRPRRPLRRDDHEGSADLVDRDARRRLPQWPRAGAFAVAALRRRLRGGGLRGASSSRRRAFVAALAGAGLVAVLAIVAAWLRLAWRSSWSGRPSAGRARGRLGGRLRRGRLGGALGGALDRRLGRCGLAASPWRRPPSRRAALAGVLGAVLRGRRSSRSPAGRQRTRRTLRRRWHGSGGWSR